MHDWRNIILKGSEPLKSAIEALNKEALQIVLVVDGEGKLIGTITDGDVRRGLLNQDSLTTPLAEVMFTTPTVAKQSESREEILNAMKKRGLLQIPVVDDSHRVVGLETLKDLIEKDTQKSRVFLMAGGFGTRLHPLTSDTPKPLLKVGNKPILQAILESFIEQGFVHFYISTHFRAEQVRAYFGNGSNWGVDIEYIHEERPLGTAGALGLLPEVPREPLIMMNGDLLTKVNFSELLSYHQRQAGIATMCVREYDFQVPFGVVTEKEGFVADIVEKPTHRFFINAGIYVLEPKLIQEVSGYGVLSMPDLFKSQLKQEEKVNLFPIYEYWLDIGRRDEFEQAQIDIKQFT